MSAPHLIINVRSHPFSVGPERWTPRGYRWIGPIPDVLKEKVGNGPAWGEAEIHVTKVSGGPWKIFAFSDSVVGKIARWVPVVQNDTVVWFVAAPLHTTRVSHVLAIARDAIEYSLSDAEIVALGLHAVEILTARIRYHIPIKAECNTQESHLGGRSSLALDDIYPSSD